MPTNRFSILPYRKTPPNFLWLSHCAISVVGTAPFNILKCVSPCTLFFRISFRGWWIGMFKFCIWFSADIFTLIGWVLKILLFCVICFCSPYFNFSVTVEKIFEQTLPCCKSDTMNPLLSAFVELLLHQCSSVFPCTSWFFWECCVDVIFLLFLFYEIDWFQVATVARVKS